jgi:hypothetical protein
MNSIGGDDVVKIFGIDRSGVSGVVYNTTEIETSRNFDTFIDF